MRVPLTIWLLSLRESWRLIVVTTLVVVTVIAFAIAVPPLADGKLDPTLVPKFMFFAMVPMLSYALPFAAGFGATIATHRMVEDNEVLACHAGGISHRTLLVPALATGIVLAGVLSLLNEQVIPRFLREMESLITRDAARSILRSVETGQALTFNDVVIAAEQAISLGPDPDPTADPRAYERILLTGVAALELGQARINDAGEPETDVLPIDAEVTTNQAEVWLFHGDQIDPESAESRPGTLAVIRLEQTVARRGADVPLVRSDGFTLQPIFIPGTFDSDPKYLTSDELRRVKDKPEMIRFVDGARRDLAYNIAREDVLEAIDRDLRTFGRATLADQVGRQLILEAAGLERRSEHWKIVRPAAGDIVLTVIPSRDAIVRDQLVHAARRGMLTGDIIYEGHNHAQAMQLDLTLENVSTEIDTAGSTTGQRDRLTFPGLSTDADLTGDYRSLSTAELIAEAAGRIEAGDDSAQHLRPWLERLETRIFELRREVLSKQHERLAMSAACLVMVLTGSVIALRLKGRQPLQVYLWSFFPALACLITINSGQQLVHEHGSLGLVVLWGGVGALLIYAAVTFLAVRRH